MFDGNVTSTSQTLVEAEGAQTITITTSNNFYVLDRRDQFTISVGAMTMLYPRFKKTSTAAGTTNYDFQLAIQYRIVN
jgi:penicillin V acylase-like amidase (Ntn superfamily)